MYESGETNYVFFQPYQKKVFLLACRHYRVYINLLNFLGTILWFYNKSYATLYNCGYMFRHSAVGMLLLLNKRIQCNIYHATISMLMIEDIFLTKK